MGVTKEKMRVYEEPTEKKKRVIQVTNGLMSKSYYAKLTGNEINYDITAEKQSNGKYKFKVISPEIPKKYQVKEQKSQGITILEDAKVFNKRKQALENAKIPELDENGNETGNLIPKYEEVRAVRQEMFIYDKLPVRAKSNFSVDKKVEGDRYVYEIESDDEHFEFGESSGTVDLKTDLILYYTLDEESGAIIDSTGNINATSVGADYGYDGKIGNSMNFIRANADRIETDGDVNITNADSYSVNAWINLSKDSEDEYYQPIFSMGDGTPGAGASSGVYVDRSSTTDLFHGGGQPSLNFVIPNTVTLLNTWVMVSATYDGSTYSVYVNGDNIYNETSLTLDVTKSDLWIGEFKKDDDNHNFDGQIDEFGLWSKALNSDEVSALYNSGNGLSYDDFDTWDKPANATIKITDQTITKTSNANIQIQYSFTKSSNSRVQTVNTLTKPSNSAVKKTLSLTKPGNALITEMIQGTVTLNGSAVENAKVTIIDSNTNEVYDNTTTDASGYYMFGVLTGTYHAVVEYESGGTKYNAKSKPYLVVS